MSLTGDQESPSEFNPSILGEKRTDLWFYPNTFASPDFKMILFGEGTAIWGVNIETEKSLRLILPKRPHFPSFEAISPPAALSPEAQMLAVAVEQSRLAFPFLVDNYVFQDTKIAVIQINPFRLLDLLPYGRTVYKPAFALYHREGSTTILAYRHNHWERDEVKGPPNP